MALYTREYVEARDHWYGISDGPDELNRKRRKGIRVYNNAFIEFVLARSHWVLPGVWFLPLASYLIYTSTASWSLPVLAGLVVAGVLAWTLLEYNIHRWIMHIVPGENAFVRDFIFLLHGYHHEFPDDPWRLVAPPLMSWPIAAIIAGIYWTLLGAAAAPVFAGTLLGYVAYDWIHYFTHHARPKKGVGKFLRVYHIQHHYRDHDDKFGISSPLWDVLLGTYGLPVQRSVPKREVEEVAAARRG